VNEVRTRLDTLTTKLIAPLHAVKKALLPERVATWRTRRVSRLGRRGWQSAWRGALPLLAFAAGWFVAFSAMVALGHALNPKFAPPSPMHFEEAVTVAALLLTPRRRWWPYLVLIGPLLLTVNGPLVRPITAGDWVIMSVGWVVLSVVPVLAVSLLRRFVGAPVRFATVGEVGGFLACVAVAAVPGGFAGQALSVFVPTLRPWPGWQLAYLGHVLGIAIFTPMLVLWLRDGWRSLGLATRRRRVELALLGLSTVALGLLVFATRLPDQDIAYALVYVLVPVLIWAAVRFGPQGLASALAVVTTIAIIGAVYDRGPFVASTSSDNVAALQLFLLFVGVPLFFLAALVRERKDAAVALEGSEACYRAVVETQTELITRYRPDLTLTFVNDATCRFVGKSREQLLGTPLLADVPAGAAARVRETIQALLARPDPGILTVEHETRFHDGSLRWQQWVNRTILNSAGEVVELQGIGRDITERKHAEEALRAGEARYRMVVRTLPHSAVLLFDDELRHSFADGPGLAVLGLASAGLEGRTVWEAFPGELAGALAPHYEAALAGQAAEMDVEHAQHIYHVQVVPMPNPMPQAEASAASSTPAAPAPSGMVVLQDVTEQRRARDELERQRTLAALLGALSHEFRTLADHSPDLIIRLDPQGRVLYINPAGADLLGRPADHWLGKTIADLGMPRYAAARWAGRLRDVVGARMPRTFDVDIPLAPGGPGHALHVRLVPEAAEDSNDAEGGAIVSVLVIATDITALKQAQARLTEQASELEAIFAAKADGVGVFDRQRRLVRANPAWQALHRRYAEAAGLGADPAFAALPLADQVVHLILWGEHGRVIPREQRPTSRALRGETITGAGAVDEWVHSPDGQAVVVFSVSAAPVRDQSGRITGAVTIVRDVTERRQLERRVAEQASELAASFEAQADVVVVYDRQGRFVRGNRAWEDFVQQSADLRGLGADPAFATSPLADRVAWLTQQIQDEHGHPIPVANHPTTRALRGETVTGSAAVDEWYQLTEGRDVLLNVSAAPIRDRAGQITGVVAVGRDVTEHRWLERQVAEQAAQLEAIFDSIADGVLVVDRDGHPLRANRAWQDTFRRFCELSGLSREPAFADLPLAAQVDRWIQWQRVNRYLPQDARGQALPHDAAPTYRALRGETVTGADAVDERFEAPDGRVYEASVSSAPVRDASGTIVGAVTVARDVTERRALERRVREQAGQLETIFAAMTDGLFVLDARGHVTRNNPAAQALLLLTAGEDRAAEAVNLTAAERRSALGVRDSAGHPLPAELLPAARLLRGEVLSGATALTVQVGTHPDRTRSISFTGGPLRDATGRIVGAVGVARDVTELQRVQAALAERERQYRTLVEHSPDIITRFDPMLRTLYINPRGEEALGISAAERAGKTFAEAGLPEALYAPWERAIREVFASGEPRELDVTSPIGGGGADDDRNYHYRARYIPEPGPDGTVATVLAITTDVTELRRAETHLAQQASQLEAIFEAQADGVGVYDLRGNFVRANTALRRLLGFAADGEYTARPLAERAERLLNFDERGRPLSPERWPHWRVLRGEILAGASALETRVRTLDGREVWTSITGAPIRARDGQVTGAVLVTRDVTARRELERRLQTHSARAATEAERARLARELHDTVTQELYSANLIAEALPRVWDRNPAQAERALVQLHDITSGGLATLRLLLLELRPDGLEGVALPTVLRQLLAAMRTRAGVPLSLDTAGADGDWESLPQEVKQAFYRMAQEAVTNAVKYAAAGQIAVRLWPERRGTLRMEIADDGVGFDPHTSTPGHFGLSIMRDRAQGIGATVQIRSQVGHGTRVVIRWRDTGKGPDETSAVAVQQQSEQGEGNDP
jgi:PAS domain S-box-containing protein